MALIRKVPWIVWGLLAPAVIIGAVDLLTPAGKRVFLVGAGPIGLLRQQDAVEGRFHYNVDGLGDGSHAVVADRIQDAIGNWPDVIVIGLDLATAAQKGEEHARSELMRLTKQAENATAVPVVLAYAPGPDAPVDQVQLAQRLTPWFRSILCNAGPLRVCVDAMDYRGDPDGLRAAVRHAVADALNRQADLRASTQVGR